MGFLPVVSISSGSWTLFDYCLAFWVRANGVRSEEELEKLHTRLTKYGISPEPEELEATLQSALERYQAHPREAFFCAGGLCIPHLDQDLMQAWEDFGCGVPCVGICKEAPVVVLRTESCAQWLHKATPESLRSHVR